MNPRLLCAVFACAIAGISQLAHAVGVSGQGTWETTLEARDLDGDISTIEAYYDTVLHITWLADANLAKSNTFGVDGIRSDGSMSWSTASNWILAMNAAGGTGYLGFNDWRLPTVSPIDDISFNMILSSNATTDNGTAAATTDGSDGGWRDSGNSPVSEMGHMYYVSLGNLGFCDPSSPWCVTQVGWGLANTGPFTNLVDRGYWFGTELDSSRVWFFYFWQGVQTPNDNFNEILAWAVRDGDVGNIADTDEDGIVDNEDNCILVPNGSLLPDAGGNSQLDTDDDGYGNICDPDFDNNGNIDFADLAYLKSLFFTPDKDADLDGNDRVDFADLAILKASFFQPPGPSYVDFAPPAISEPILKWAYGGCTSYCESGWHSSPAVSDLDGDNKQEIIAGGHTLHALNGEDGSIQWQFPPTGRVWAGVIVDDIDNDLDFEILMGNSSGHVIALSHTGSPIWDTTISTAEVRSLSVFDLDNDNSAEIIAGLAIPGSQNTWVLEHDGNTRTGWPQLDGTTASRAFGIYNSNIAVGDIDKNNLGEIYAPSDVAYIAAYHADGSEIQANTIYGIGSLWGMVPTYESAKDELQGWSACVGPRNYLTNFASGPAVISDLDNDTNLEIVVIGNTRSFCDLPESKYNGAYIFDKDRTRYNKVNYDWTTPPLDITGPPVTEDYNIIEPNVPNPAVADLDSDGEKEIIFSSYDGKVHAIWLDKTEHGNWPYSINQGSDGFFRLSGEPVVADLNNDGSAEVIVASWTEKGSNAVGKLHILDSDGSMLFETELPAALTSVNWNGALAAPTLANVDDDADLEVILNTVYSGIVVYDLPGTENANVLWGTGRGNYSRNGYQQ
jgi:hypothetical protein